MPWDERRNWKGNNSVDSWLSSLAKGTRLDFPPVESSMLRWLWEERKYRSASSLLHQIHHRMKKWSEHRAMFFVFSVIKWIFPFWCSFHPWKENSRLVYALSFLRLDLKNSYIILQKPCFVVWEDCYGRISGKTRSKHATLSIFQNDSGWWAPGLLRLGWNFVENKS